MGNLQRFALRIPLFFATIIWAIVAMSPAASAHGVGADTGDIAVAGQLSDGKPPEDASGTRHATSHECHGGGMTCHFYAASHAAQRDWPNRKDRDPRLHGSVPYSGREITPLLRPPRGYHLPG